mmetsp:Transcript_2942/g.5335  ORF Transcript_2942/g.5335 Transcript_2942/m.5335 type:complete len:278 (+) Transcript_2942:63-896(+)
MAAPVATTQFEAPMAYSIGAAPAMPTTTLTAAPPSMPMYSLPMGSAPVQYSAGTVTYGQPIAATAPVSYGTYGAMPTQTVQYTNMPASAPTYYATAPTVTGYPAEATAMTAPVAMTSLPTTYGQPPAVQYVSSQAMPTAPAMSIPQASLPTQQSMVLAPQGSTVLPTAQSMVAYPASPMMAPEAQSPAMSMQSGVIQQSYIAGGTPMAAALPTTVVGGSPMAGGSPVAMEVAPVLPEVVAPVDPTPAPADVKTQSVKANKSPSSKKGKKKKFGICGC